MPGLQLKLKGTKNVAVDFPKLCQEECRRKDLRKTLCCVLTADWSCPAKGWVCGLGAVLMVGSAWAGDGSSNSSSVNASGWT